MTEEDPNSMFDGMKTEATSGFTFITEPTNEENTTGFSFLSQPSEEINEDISNTSTGFSFLQQETIADPPPETSGFGFLAASDGTDNTIPPSEGSGFGFLSNQSHEPNPPPIPESSGFGFLSTPSEPESTSGFSFLGNQTADVSIDHSQQPSLVSQHSHDYDAQNSVQEIKLGKTASSKVVKKKKRAPKVGYARDEGDDDDNVNATPASIPSVDSAEQLPQNPQPDPPISTAAVAHPPRLEEAPLSPPTQLASPPESTSAVSNPGDVPSYILRKEELMRKANGASTTPPMVPVEPQRRDSRTLSDVPKVNPAHTAVHAPEPSPPNPSESSSKRQGSSGNGFMSFFFSGKKETPATPEKNVPVKPATQPVPHQATDAPTSTVSHAPALQPPLVMQTQPQVSSTEVPPSRSRVASNPPVVVPVEIQTQNNAPAPQSSISSADMFLGMSTTTSSVSIPASNLPEVRKEPPRPVENKAAGSPAPNPTKKHVTSPPKPVKLNNADVCEQIKILSAEVVGGFQKQVSEQATRQLQLVENGRTLRLSLDQEEINGRRLQKLVEETEKEQLRLAEAEEFELADALSIKLEQIREEVKTSAGNLIRIQTEIVANDEELASLRSSQSSLFDSTVKGLSNLLRQQKEEIDKYLSANQSRLREDDTRISAEEERVQMERSGVAREEASLEEEKNEIETVINSQTVEIERDREDIEMKLMGVTAEIKNLEKLLEQKRKEEIELKSGLAVVEEKIGVVRKKYERRLQRIHERVIDLTSDSEACRKEEEVIQQQRKLYLEDKNFVDRTEKDIDSWLLWMEGEIEVTSRLKSALENIRITNNSPNMAVQDSSNDHHDLVSLKEKVSICENEVSLAADALKNAQDMVGQLMDEDADITEKLPQLEAEKKAHATNKRFKEAGNIAKTIKTLSTRKEEIAELLQQSAATIASAESELQLKKELQSAALKDLNEAEKTVDIVRLNDLVVQIKELRKANNKALREIHKLTPVPTKTSSDLVDPALQLSQIALCFLQAELESAVSAAIELKEKHELDVSLDEDPEEEETSEVAPQEEVEEPVVEQQGVEADIVESTEEAASEEIENVVDSTPREDSNVEQESTPEPIESQEAQPAPEEKNEAQHEENLKAAHELIETIASKEVELEAAVDEEDYDRAAELSEIVDSSKEQLQLVLQSLSMTKEEVIAYFHPES